MLILGMIWRRDKLNVLYISFNVAKPVSSCFLLTQLIVCALNATPLVQVRTTLYVILNLFSCYRYIYE